MSLSKERQCYDLLTAYHHLVMGRKVGHESNKTYAAKLYAGFFDRYLSGNNILDIGYRGTDENVSPIVPQAVGIDENYPGYDGLHLPFADESQDAVYSSHCLEHIDDDVGALREWFRVIKTGGYLVLAVPHQYLYERRRELLGSITNHKHFYTPSTLLKTIEEALQPNHYRIRSLNDNDMFYDYTIPLGHHPVGCYEIEVVLQKIKPPSWMPE